MDTLNNGDNVLIIWSNADQTSLQTFVNDVQSRIKNGSVVLENAGMITELSRPQSSFDVILSNFITPHSVRHSDELLSVLIKLLKPCGKLLLKDDTDLNTTLKLNGFVNINKAPENHYVAEKPRFEVGSKASLKLNGHKEPAVWKLDDTVEAAWARMGDTNDDDLIDDDQLLDEEDLKMPDQASLRVCASTGKRKACADCTCGLAEELAGEVKDTPKSSCGSCYLGDAFRCSTCPYLGMPAFKPGEKVMLDLKSDV